MNFGPINNAGGERRLNVIFSRAKRHMAVIASMRGSDITNVHNEGANHLAGFLRYAEADSVGDEVEGRPGVSFGAVRRELMDRIGDEVNFPLYVTDYGSGSNKIYVVSNFARFLITDVTGVGNNIVIQGIYSA